MGKKAKDGFDRKNSTIFYWEWHTNIMRQLSYQERGVLLSALFDYDMGDEQDEVLEIVKQDKTLNLLFETLKPSLDRNRAKYRETCISNGIIANKRDYPGISDEEAERMYFEKHPEMNERQRTLTNATDSDSEYDNEKEKDNEKDDVNEKVKEKDARENHQGKLNYGKDIIEYCKIKHFDFRDLSAAELSRLTTNPNWKLELDSIIALERIAI